MRETEYAYSVARIRANETALLAPADIEQLVSAPDYGSVVRLLADKGWAVPENGESFDIAERELTKAWELIAESAPDASLLEALVVANDFFNLKAAIKCVFSDRDPAEYYVYPCITDTQLITQAVTDCDFSELPEYLASCAQTAYEAVSKLESGQLAESVLDRASLEARLAFAKKSESALMMRIAGLYAACANIKTALRCRTMGKSDDFALDAMCDCGMNNRELLQSADGGDKLAEYLSSTEYGFLAESIKKGFAEFEKQCDNAIVSWLESAKYETFGPDPIIAYYFAKQAETKNVRIILSAKASGIPAETILQRVRDIYV